jgi:hypothetical protein
VVDPAENNDEESASGYRVPCSAGATSMYGREYCDKKWFKFRFDCNHVEVDSIRSEGAEGNRTLRSTVGRGLCG